MQRIRKQLLLALGLLATGVAIALGAQTCPIDKTNMAFTGNTRQEMGKTLAEYKCVHGHVYWIPVN